MGQTLRRAWKADGVFIMALTGSGVRATWSGDIGDSLDMPNMLRQMADDFDRKMGRKV